MSMTKGAVRPNVRREDEKMTTKEWLSRGRSLELEITQLKMHRERALDDATSITVGSYDRVQSSKANGQEKKMIQYADYSMVIKERIDELHQVREEIFQAICQVEDGTLRALLIGRYLNCKTWEELSTEMHYSYQHMVQCLHPKALHLIESYIAPEV